MSKLNINIKEKEKKVIFNFQIPVKNKKKIQKILKKEGITLSKLLNSVIVQYIEESEEA